MSINMYAAQLHLLSSTFVFGEGSDDVLRAISSAIGDCGRAIDKAEASGDERYLDAVVDAQCEAIENLLGIAFVACQTHVTAVKSAVEKLHRRADADGHALATTTGKKPSILAFGSPLVDGTEVTGVAAIDAFANYFKHRDEWSMEWSRLSGLSKSTAETVAALGASSGSTGNLRAGARALGNENFEDVHLFRDAIEEWRRALAAAYKSELAGLGLV